MNSELIKRNRHRSLVVSGAFSFVCICSHSIAFSQFSKKNKQLIILYLFQDNFHSINQSYRNQPLKGVFMKSSSWFRKQTSSNFVFLGVLRVFSWISKRNNFKMALIKFVVNKIRPKFGSFLFAFFMKPIPLFLDSSLLCWKFLLHKAPRVQKNTRFLTRFGVLAETPSSSKLKLTLNLFEIQVTQTLDLSNLSLVPPSNSLFSRSLFPLSLKQEGNLIWTLKE